MNVRKKIFVCILSIIYVGFLPLLVWLSSPSKTRIENERELKVGYVETLSGSVLEVHIMIGDVFTPRNTRRDIGFDITPISCYFDPVELVSGDLLLLTNPLLNSALFYSARDSTEFIVFLANIIKSLEMSKEVIACFLLDEQNGEPCEGDQLTPYVWLTYHNSIMRAQGTKYLAALPLFDPTILMEKYPSAEMRRRLKNNVEAAVRRLILYCDEELGSTVRSVGLAALGATSHRGGDSEYFLEFDESFLAMLKAVQLTRPPRSLDRVYFVAFEKHRGIFREDALGGLKSVCDFMTMKKIFSSYQWSPAAFVCFLLLFGISLLSFQNIKMAVGRGSRWRFFGSILAINALSVGILFGSSLSFFHMIQPFKFYLVYWWYGFVSLLSIFGVMWLCKRI